MSLLSKLGNTKPLGIGTLTGAVTGLFLGYQALVQDIDRGKIGESAACATEINAMAKQMDERAYSALINKGFDYYTKGEYEKAIAVYDKAIDGRKEDPSAYVSKSSAYRGWGKSIQEKNPKKAQELYVVSNEYAIIALEKIKANKTGRSEESIAKLSRLAYEKLGFNYKSLGDKGKAIEFLELSLKFEYNKLVDDTLKELRGN